MNISHHFSSSRRLFSGIPAGAAFLALVLFASLAPSTAHAQRFAGHGGRGFGRSFGGGLGWGLGFGIGSALIYDNVYSYGYPGVVYASAPPTVYYVPQDQAPQTIVVNPAPASVAPASAPAVSAPPVASATSSSAGKMSKIVYDANGKPLGVLILNPDGSQQFVPLAQ